MELLTNLDHSQLRGLNRMLTNVQKHREFLMANWPIAMDNTCDMLWEVEKSIWRVLMLNERISESTEQEPTE